MTNKFLALAGGGLGIAALLMLATPANAAPAPQTSTTATSGPSAREVGAPRVGAQCTVRSATRGNFIGCWKASSKVVIEFTTAWDDGNTKRTAHYSVYSEDGKRITDNQPVEAVTKVWLAPGQTIGMWQDSGHNVTMTIISVNPYE